MPLYIPPQSIDDPSVPPEWVEVQRASKVLDEMCNEFIDEVRLLRKEPMPGSVREQDANLDREMADLFAQCAQDRLLFSLDNALGASRCVKHPTLSHAAYACARATVDTSSALYWLLDDGENPGTKARFARALELYRRHVESKRIWDMSVRHFLNKNESDANRFYEQHIDSLIRNADYLGIPCEWKDERHGRHRLPKFAKLPDATTRAARCIEHGDLDYRSYSRIIHCETFAVAVSWLVQPNIASLTEPVYADQLALLLVRNLAGWIAKVTYTLYSYWGLDLEELDRHLLVYFTRLRLGGSSLTWRRRGTAS